MAPAESANLRALRISLGSEAIVQTTMTTTRRDGANFGESMHPTFLCLVQVTHMCSFQCNEQADTPNEKSQVSAWQFQFGGEMARFAE